MRPSVLFLGLDTYGRVGGLQMFNRRLLANLDALVREGRLAAATAHLMGDATADAPIGLTIEDFGRDRIGFVRRTLGRARHADWLLIGHLNLLPVAWLAKRLKPSLRTVLFAHGDEVWATALRPRRPFEARLLNAIDRVAAVSGHTARVMSAAYGVGPDRFTLFPNAVDAPPAPDRGGAGGRRVLCVTRMGEGDADKHVDVLIRAMGRLAAAGRPASLTIVGDGALRPGLEALVGELGLRERVSFLGGVSDAARDAAYARSDVFVLPSSKEGFGIVFLEAWRQGLPVICGRRGAPVEIIEDGVDGLVADETRADDLADKIDRLLSDPDKAREIGRRGRAKVEALYLNANARRHLEALLGLDEPTS